MEKHKKAQDGYPRTIFDSRDIWLEVVAGVAICRECTISQDGSVASVDYPCFSSTDSGEFTAHLLKHRSLRQDLADQYLEEELWISLLHNS